MATNLSTDELFHYTKFGHLLNIIENGFYPRYSFEYTFLSDFYPNHPAMLSPVPMVCFCDIPLNMVADHITKYGTCAIGLTKQWGASHGINPVLYVNKNSIAGVAMNVLGASSHGYKSPEDMATVQRFTNIFEATEKLGYFLKQYERVEDESVSYNGKIYVFKKGRYYDEREWRYVPPLTLFERAEHIHAFSSEVKLKAANEMLKKYVIRFRLADIKYIVCNNEDEKQQLINAISKTFHSNNILVEHDITFKLVSELS